MSNIKTAISALKAEIKTAKEGLAFYKTRVVSLEGALAGLESVEIPGLGSSKRRGRKPGGPAATGKRGRPAASVSSKNIDGKLPSTGKDFWPSLIASKPMTGAEIYAAAIKNLGITPTNEQAKKLAQRQANALSILCKKGLLSSSGSGRARQYFK
jgi:hypothetical protein